MKYPILSFVISILFCFLLLGVSFISFSKGSKKIVPATIEIEAMEIKEVSNSLAKELPKKIEQEQDLAENNDSEKIKETKQQEKISNNQTSKNKALIVYGPLPKIPDHLRDEAFSSFAIARFNINEDGSSRVELIKPCNNPELNYLLLKSLKKWQFEKSEKKSVQEIKVNFLVN